MDTDHQRQIITTTESKIIVNPNKHKDCDWNLASLILF
jgi:hypothetical protein